MLSLILNYTRYYSIYVFSVHIVPYGNLGCKGGNMYDAFLYVVANDGVDTSSAYAFQGKVSVGIERCVHSLLSPEGLCFNTQSTLLFRCSSHCDRCSCINTCT